MDKQLAGALYHEIIRNHPHNPQACSACEEAEKLYEALRDGKTNSLPVTTYGQLKLQ